MELSYDKAALQTYMDDIGSVGSLGGSHDGDALAFRLSPALGAFVQADNDIDAAVLQVQGVGVALGAVADDGDGLAGELLQIAVLLIKNTIFHNAYLFLVK